MQRRESSHSHVRRGRHSESARSSEEAHRLCSEETDGGEERRQVYHHSRPQRRRPRRLQVFLEPLQHRTPVRFPLQLLTGRRRRCHDATVPATLKTLRHVT